MSDTATALPLLLETATVVSREQLSPHFVRFELGAAGFADFGVDGNLYDQRFKIVFPPESGVLPSFEGADESWFATWLDIPAEERGHMRTLTIRDIRGEGTDTRIVVDFAVHFEGEIGPAAQWALDAEVGDQVIVLAPKKGMEFGGIEFLPGTADEVLLVGDETAVPAVCAILEQLPSEAKGAAFLEVPTVEDILPLDFAAEVEVTWVPRAGTERGAALMRQVLAHMGVNAGHIARVDGPDDTLWETPIYSSSGEEIADDARPGRFDGLYAWIGGESGIVTGLRRCLVRDYEMPRKQVSFMGYWKQGVSMRS